MSDEKLSAPQLVRACRQFRTADEFALAEDFAAVLIDRYVAQQTAQQSAEHELAALRELRNAALACNFHDWYKPGREDPVMARFMRAVAALEKAGGK